MTEPFNPPGFWTTVRLLLGSARRRSVGRRERQRQLFQQRSGRATNWGGIGSGFGIFIMVVLNVLAAFVLRTAVSSAQRVQAEREGKIVVSSSFLEFVQAAENTAAQPSDENRYLEPPNYERQARQIVEEEGGSRSAIEAKLRESVDAHGSGDLITEDLAAPGIKAVLLTGRWPAMVGSAVLLMWGVMLTFQGEGLDLDLQRRRHPMWEWLFSHPVKAGAVFLAEMLSPIAANPMYWGGPLFVGCAYSFVYDAGLGAIAALVIGVPVTVAAACLGKALEIGITLRFPPRSRGAIAGIMSWLGYASMMLFFLGMFAAPRIVSVAGKFAALFTVVPWPWLGMFLGAQSDGSFSFTAGILTCLAFAGCAIAAAVWFSAWGAQKGLSGSFGQADVAPSPRRKGGGRFGREPLYRKEFLLVIPD